jgi:hypothetical protein
MIYDMIYLTAVGLSPGGSSTVGKSVGLKRFNLSGPCSSSRMDVSSFGCVNSLALQLVLNFIISSRTVDICRSVRSRLFGMYRGALTHVIRTLF